MSTLLKIVLGAGPIGDSSDPFAKYHNKEAAQEFLNVFKNAGYVNIDTARGYSPHAPKTSEPIIGQTDFAQWAILDTKVESFHPGAHNKETITQSINESLRDLRIKKCHIMYLHAPDRQTPFAETCEAMNEAYKAGKFEQFGLSNFRTDEVEEIIQICTKNDWVKPTVFQGHYNAMARLPEEELFPVLRKHGIAFYAYSPGAGGMFSGKITKDSINNEGTRWDKRLLVSNLYNNMYHKDALFDAANRVAAEAQKAGISGHEVALRWCLHHSALKGELGDAMIIGASSIKQLETNLKSCAAGPLPENLVKVVNDVWGPAREFAPPFSM